MESGQSKTKVIKAQLSDGTIIDIQSSSRGEEDVASTIFPFHEVTNKIEGIAEAVLATLKNVRPQSASVEFGIEITAESGQLTALLVKGTGTANLKITLQWGDNVLNNPMI